MGKHCKGIRICGEWEPDSPFQFLPHLLATSLVVSVLSQLLKLVPALHGHAGSTVYWSRLILCRGISGTTGELAGLS